MYSLLVMIAASGLAGGVWMPVEGSDFEVVFEENSLNFTKVVEEVGGVRCVTSWPIKHPQATAECENGDTHVLYFDMNAGVIIFDHLALIKTDMPE